MNEPTDNQPPDIETASDDYALRFSGRVGTWMLTRQSTIVLNMLEGHKDADILDVGGGHAQLARPLVERNFGVTVQGSAPECGRRIRDMTGAETCRFVSSPLLDLPFEDACVDTVLCFRLLTHCPEWPALVGELCRVAKRSVIIDFPTSRSLNAFSGGLFGVKKKLEGNTRTWRLFRSGEIEAAFQRHGFTCQAVRKQYFLPMVLHRVLRCPGLSAFLEGICHGLHLTHLWGSPVIMELVRNDASARDAHLQ